MDSHQHALLLEALNFIDASVGETVNAINNIPHYDLRDLFAMAALAGLTARGTVGAANAAWGAETAYLFADAMLKAREIK